jgi:hypothetical protein
MRKTFLFIIFFTSTFSVFSQDVIVKTNGDKIYCTITKVDSANVYLSYSRDGYWISSQIDKTKVKEIKYGRSLSNYSNALTKSRFGINAELGIPTGGVADRFRLGFGFSLNGRLAFDSSRIMLSLGADYVFFPGKTSSFGYSYDNLNFISAFLGPQFVTKTGLYFLPAITVNYADGGIQEGADVGIGALLPIGSKRTKIDVGCKFSMTNVIKKQDQIYANIIRIFMGVAF